MYFLLDLLLTDGCIRTGELVNNEEGKQLQKSLWREVIDVLKLSNPEVERYA